MQNTRVQERIVREPLFVQDSFRVLRVGASRIVRPVESAVESVVLVEVVAESVAHAITVRVVCDLASHVVERLPPHQHMNTI
jgi:hypothetical protein